MIPQNSGCPETTAGLTPRGQASAITDRQALRTADAAELSQKSFAALTLSQYSLLKLVPSPNSLITGPKRYAGTGYRSELYADKLATDIADKAVSAAPSSKTSSTSMTPTEPQK